MMNKIGNTNKSGFVEMMVMLDNAQLDELRIQPVGEGEDMIDLICPPEKIDAFLDLCNTEGIEIKGFSWWCHVTEGHEPCGMGGPKSSFFEGWFSEIPMDDIVRLPDNASYSTFFKSIWPEEDNYHDCWWPGFWLLCVSGAALAALIITEKKRKARS